LSKLSIVKNCQNCCLFRSASRPPLRGDAINAGVVPPTRFACSASRRLSGSEICPGKYFLTAFPGGSTRLQRANPWAHPHVSIPVCQPAVCEQTQRCRSLQTLIEVLGRCKTVCQISALVRCDFPGLQRNLVVWRVCYYELVGCRLCD
jgi:hypothetical protein